MMFIYLFALLASSFAWWSRMRLQCQGVSRHSLCRLLTIEELLADCRGDKGERAKQHGSAGLYLQPVTAVKHRAGKQKRLWTEQHADSVAWLLLQSCIRSSSANYGVNRAEPGDHCSYRRI